MTGYINVALIMESSRGRKGRCELLLKCGADVNYQRKNGCTAL